MIASHLNSARKPAIVMVATLLVLSLSACDTRNEGAELDAKLHRAEAAAQKAVAAQQAAEAAAERVRLSEDVGGRDDATDPQDGESQSRAENSENDGNREIADASVPGA